MSVGSTRHFTAPTNSTVLNAPTVIMAVTCIGTAAFELKDPSQPGAPIVYAQPGNTASHGLGFAVGGLVVNSTSNGSVVFLGEYA